VHFAGATFFTTQLIITTSQVKKGEILTCFIRLTAWLWQVDLIEAVDVDNEGEIV